MTTGVVVVALIAVVVGAVLKSVSGVGMPLITIPAIAYVADIETAVAVTAVPNLALNSGLAWAERQYRSSTRDLPILAVAGIIGAAIGTVVLVSVPEGPLIGLLLVVVLIYAFTFLRSPDLIISPDRSRRYSPLVGGLSGILAGSVGISAPVLVPWIHGFRLPRGAHVLSLTLLFAMAGLAQVSVLAVGGALGDGRWLVGLVACGPALATIVVGRAIRDSLSSAAFDRLIVLTVTASVVGLALRSVF